VEQHSVSEQYFKTGTVIAKVALWKQKR
jgi:hypothetical protein